MCSNLGCPGRPNCGRLPQYYVEPYEEDSVESSASAAPSLEEALREAETVVTELEEGATRAVFLSSRERQALRVVLDAAKKALGRSR